MEYLPQKSNHRNLKFTVSTDYSRLEKRLMALEVKNANILQRLALAQQWQVSITNRLNILAERLAKPASAYNNFD